MNTRILHAGLATLTCALLLSACGGGGGESSSATVVAAPVQSAATTGPDMFLLFPNAIRLDDGTLEMNTPAYAQAYYEAIDPNNDKDTLAKWKAANGFGTTAGTLGEVSATFGDVRDLGYGRRMSARQNPDGTIAMFVENYQVNAGEGYTYTRLNLDAAVAAVQGGGANGTRSDNRWHIGTNAIEFSPGPNGGAPFVKFYTFSPTTGQRELVADLDGRGNKAMPGICINCHGGRGDPLTPAGADGKPLFPLAQNSVSQHRGDVQGRMQMFNLDVLDFAATPGFTRAELEPVLKSMNRMVLCSYPLSAPSALPEDACRPAASVAASNEWQGTAAQMLKAAYGGDGLPNANFSDTYVPTGWLTAGQSTLYRNVVRPACITCHSVRGTGNQSEVDFMSYAKFQGYSDRIKAHVIERGNMPLAKIVYEDFWASNAPNELAVWLESLGLGYAVRDSQGLALRPGRPIADPGPDRTVRRGPVTLSAANSLYASTYNWTISSNPGNAASLTNASSATPTFNATADGTYLVQLVASNGATSSAPVTLKLVVNNGLTPAPSAIRFADVKTVLQSAGCTTCHTTTAVAPRPPLFFTDIDRNGDSTVDATDDAWFYKEVRGRVNFADVVASPLLRKPSNHHHNGGLQPGFDNSLEPGSPGRANYDLILNWILNGAPR
ncbi:hypothetical protein EDC30_103266 [Paucimonas lemoignei]|uniref:PKD domain-containing protein n=1 Tax=Paucimonas lemoignei TaxID=29443 RepID=A0A4R3HYN4_PAULE|nr:PKD domain-containing protein [Paucimonas lemoignei]TCS37974.1 hypothetical protein EDC30_103266 [Paucimonas lemoignei]